MQCRIVFCLACSYVSAIGLHMHVLQYTCVYMRQCNVHLSSSLFLAVPVLAVNDSADTALAMHMHLLHHAYICHLLATTSVLAFHHLAGMLCAGCA
jgi:hypothetical protein